MADEFETKMKADIQPRYAPPRALRMSHVREGGAQCVTPGSSPAAEPCMGPGNIANPGDCLAPGNTAVDECKDGQGADPICLEPGNAPTVDCTMPGLGFAP